MFHRQLNLGKLLEKKSHFLFGPRATGKTYLIREELKEGVIVINLLQSNLYLRLSDDPSSLESIIDAQMDAHPDKKPWVVIDEVQKIPILLDEVQRLIEERHFTFLLTGSSARKLKRGHANLLAGRAWTANLFPLTYSEIPNFDLERYLRWGGLPAVYQSDNPDEELAAYVNTYLYEEIQAEGLVRKLPQFARFLKSAALSNGQLLNFAQIGSDSAVSASTVREYYSILEDTLLGFQLNPWNKSKKRKAIETAKFYLFDPGVTHTISQTTALDRNSDLYGQSFEQWIGMELKAYLSYRRLKDPLCYWRSVHQNEVDFIVGDHTAIEVKATKSISEKHFKGLIALQEENIVKNFILISQDPIETKKGPIQTLHWKTFVEKLWSDQLFK